MSYTYKVYIAGGQEHFVWECDTAFFTTKRAIKKDFEFSQSLLDLFYLDANLYLDSLKRIGELVRTLPMEQENRNVPPELIGGLDQLARRHVYFEFLRLDWFEKLDRYLKGENISLWYKALTHIPMHIITFQNGMKPLFTDVLDALTDSKKSIQQKIAALYGKKGSLTRPFEFKPLTVGFERVDDKTFTDVLYPRDLVDFVDFFLREFVKRELALKECKSCGLYFPASHGNSEYCNRLFQDTGKTCREIGSVKAYQAKVESNPAIKEYNRAYKTHYARIKAGKMTKDFFQEWAQEAREKRDLVTAGKLTLEEYQMWIERH